MRILLFVLGILVGTAVLGSRAEAQNYPWCALGGKFESSAHCGFTSFQQCMATVSGLGGFCIQNTQYVPTVVTPGPRYRPRHKADRRT
jgi:hypothetical protein